MKKYAQGPTNMYLYFKKKLYGPKHVKHML